MTAFFVRVALPRPVTDTFHYWVPDSLDTPVAPGSIVHVPFGKRTMTGVVTEVVESSPVQARNILAVSGQPPLPRSILQLAQWTASYYQSPPGMLLKLAVAPSGGSSRGPRFSLTDRGRRLLEAGDTPQYSLLETLKRGPRTAALLVGRFGSADVEAATGEGLIAPLTAVPATGPVEAPYRRSEKTVTELTSAQREALGTIEEAVTRNRFGVILVKGVTGSGKTEVYLRAARHALASGRRVLLLVPEISLTPLLVSRLQAVAPGQVATLHSRMTGSQRRASFGEVISGRARLVVGVRSGVFAPVPDLGLIIVDEEHDPSYRQEDTPSYNARDVAVKRGQMENIPVVLGSATPSIESWSNARSGKYALTVLPERVSPSSPPELVLVDMSEPEEVDPAQPSLSRTLLTELEGVVSRKEQAILFLNRRGLSPFLLCGKCRETVLCPNCSVTLTYHTGGRVVCHYCGHRQPLPEKCPGCGRRDLIPVGAGTQKVEQALRDLFPGVNVDRLDRDALEKAGSLERIYRRMDSGDTHILVGTQMLAKGHDFQGVTLAGILSAEQALDLPDFRSAERTFQIITQVAGRAGRGERPGKVVIQTHIPDHYAITTALSGDHEPFYEREASSRRALGYPPFGRLGRIILDGTREEVVARAAHDMAGSLSLPARSRLLGPSPAPLARIRNRYRWHILVLTPSHGELTRVLNAAREKHIPGIRVTTRVDPVQLL